MFFLRGHSVFAPRVPLFHTQIPVYSRDGEEQNGHERVAVPYPVADESNAQEDEMTDTSAKGSWETRPAGKSGQFHIAGQLTINRLGFGAMRITGKGIWGPPQDRGEAFVYYAAPLS